MSTAPQFRSLDRLPIAGLPDLVAARASLLRDVAANQHSLMTGWGGPPQARTLMIIAETGATASNVCSVRVPPGVTHANVSLLLQGQGIATLTTSADATGTTLRSVSQFSSAENLEAADWYSTEGVYDATEGAESGRALQLVSSVSWSYQTANVTVSLDASGTRDLSVWAAVFRPVHVPR